MINHYKSINPKTDCQYSKSEIYKIYNIDHKQLDRFIANEDNFKNKKEKNKKNFT